MRGGRWEVGRRFVGLALNVGLLAVLSLVSIPAMISNAGDTGWGSIALGQAIGMFLSIPLAYGWGFHGPATVARARDDQVALSREVAESLKLRGILLPGTFALGVVLALVTTPSDPVLAIAGFTSVVLLGLRMSWLYVGLGSPRLLFLLETLPRSIGLVASILILALIAGSAVLALVVQAFSILVTVVLAMAWERRAFRIHPRPRTRSVRVLLREHAHGVAGQSTSALWSSLPTMTIAMLAPTALPSFALGMRVYAQANTAVSPLVDGLQGWVPRSTEAETIARSRRALGISFGAATLIAIGFLLLGAPVMNLLGAGEVSTRPLEVDLLAIAIALSLMAQTVNRVVLASLGLAKQYALNTYLSVALGATLLLSTVVSYGTVAGYLSIIAALFAQFALGAAQFIRRGRQPGH